MPATKKTSTAFITNGNGKKISAVIPIKQYLQILKDLEAFEELRAYDKAKAKKETPIPLRDAIRQRRKK